MPQNMVDKPAMQLTSIENALYQVAQGYEGVTNIKEQLLAEAMTKGLTSEEAEAVVTRVIAKLNKPKQKARRFGKAQDPVKRANHIAQTIANLGRY